MSDVAGFVRGTLALAGGLAVALWTLIVGGVTFRPLRGALRCRARSLVLGPAAPDGRLLLFVASFVFAVLCSHGFQEGASALTLGRIMLARDAAGGAIVIEALLFYFVCELSIAGSFPRRVSPGRRGRRNREIVRFLLASLLIQVAIWEPLAARLLAAVAPDGSAAATVTVKPPILAVLVAVGRLVVFLLVPLAPFAVLTWTVGRSAALRPASNGSRLLALLPVTLTLSFLAADLITTTVLEDDPPVLVSIRCSATPSSGSAMVAVDALILNRGNGWWRPRGVLKLALLQPPEGERSFEDRMLMLSDVWTGGDAGRSDAMVVGPHTTARYTGRAFFEGADIAPDVDLRCGLVSGRPLSNLQGRLGIGVPSLTLVWEQVSAGPDLEGSVALPSRQKTGGP